MRTRTWLAIATIAAGLACANAKAQDAAQPAQPAQAVPAAPVAPAIPAPPPTPLSPYVIPELYSGLPAGRLIPLPILLERQIRELADDVAMHLQITGGYTRLQVAYQADIPAFPVAVTPDFVIARSQNGTRSIVRIGHVMAARRLPQLWVQGFTMRDGKFGPNPDVEGANLDDPLRRILAERVHIFTRLRLTDLETTTIPLSYVDADAALFALRAMGYAAITDSESLAKDDSYKGEDVGAYDLARAAADAQSNAAAAAALQGQAGAGLPPGTPQGLSPDDLKRFLPKFPAIKNLPTTISLDRLPLVVKMPSTDAKNMGLVGADLSPAQRDQLGLTVVPSAASPLNETVAGGSSELLVLYHPAYPEQLIKLKRLIDEQIDKPARQVYIEAMVLEISDEGLKDLGVQWDIKKGNQAWSIGSIIPVAPGGSAFSFLRDTTQNITPSQITARIAALISNNKAEVLSRPSVITLDNRQATIRVGTDIPVATSKDASAAGTSSNRVAFSFQYIPTGILLNVRPRVSDDLAEISMLIDATVSATVPGADLQVLDPATKIVLASAPTLSTRRVQTYARIRDNQPLIIGGLLSRNQIKSYDRVPVLGSIPVVGALFGHTNTQDDRREVIIVLTPSVVTENIRETKAQYPKDDDRFDQFGTVLFKEHYRIRAEDLVDSSDFRFNARFRTYRDIANKVMERKPELQARQPFTQFLGNRVPGEFIFVTGMMYRMLDRLNQGDPIKIENLKFFERADGNDLRPVSVAQALAHYGDGVHADSFFKQNPGKALAFTFTLSRSSMSAGDEFLETVPEVRLVDCPDRETWRRLLWDMSKPNDKGVPRFTILINDPSDLRRLQLAFATNNTVLNNGGIAGQVFDRFLPGRMLHLQEVSPTWERIVNAQIAQYFVIGEYYYMYFAQEFTKSLRNLEVALRTDEIQPLLEGIRLPP
jgi:general secretion pathway protein D